MRHVAFRAKELRRLGREVLKQCSDTLLPLREEVRQHNALSSAISHLLGQIRKRGLKRTLRNGDLPLWQRDFPRRVSVGGEVLSVMGEALNYTPAAVHFPDDDTAAVEPMDDLVDDASLVAALRQEAPIENLLEWLHRYEPRWSV